MSLRNAFVSVATVAALSGAVFVADTVTFPTPAVAESGCYSSPPGDVYDLGAQKEVDAPEADLLAMCVDHDDQRIRITARTLKMEDPATGAIWANERLAMGAVLDVNEDKSEEYSLNVVRNQANQVSATVIRTDNSDKVCDAQATFDGVRYVVDIQRACLKNPRSVAVATFMLRNPSFLPDGSQLGQINDIPFKRGMVGPFATNRDALSHRVRQLAGPSRVHTAMAISQSQFKKGQAGAVVLARQGNFPDALAGASLARSVNGPMLLTVHNQLYPEVAQEMRRVLAPGATVYLAGGPNALNPQVEQAIQGLGFKTRRLAGASRVETATLVAEATNPNPHMVVVADGRTFADALIAGSLASHLGGVQLLTDGDQLHPANAAWLAKHPNVYVIAIGSPAARALGTRANKIYDEGDPMATSLKVAQNEYQNPTAVGIANGTRFPDGLAGGPNIASVHGPLLLTYPDVLPEDTKKWLANQSQISEVRGYGGPVAISTQILNDAARR